MRCPKCQSDEPPVEVNELGSYDKLLLCRSCAAEFMAHRVKTPERQAKVEASLPPSHMERALDRKTVDDLMDLLGELS